MKPPTSRGVWLVRIYGHRLDVRTGIWCPTCLLPSAISTWIGWATSNGRPLSVSHLTVCRDCGAEVPPG